MWYLFAAFVAIQIILSVVMYRFLVKFIQLKIIDLLNLTINDVHTRFSNRIRKLEAVVTRDIITGGNIYESAMEGETEESMVGEEDNEDS